MVGLAVVIVPAQSYLHGAADSCRFSRASAECKTVNITSPVSDSSDINQYTDFSWYAHACTDHCHGKPELRPAAWKLNQDCESLTEASARTVIRLTTWLRNGLRSHGRAAGPDLMPLARSSGCPRHTCPYTASVSTTSKVPTPVSSVAIIDGWLG